MYLDERVSSAMNYSMSDLKKLRLRYFDLVGVVHSVLKTTRSRYVLRLTRLEEIPIQLDLRPGGFFKVKPDMISHFEVDSVFDVEEKFLLDIVIYDEHIDIARDHLKSGDMVVLTNLHFTVGKGSDVITLHGTNKNKEKSNERGVFVIPDDFVDHDKVYTSFRWSIDQQIKRKPVVTPLHSIDANNDRTNGENRNNGATITDEFNEGNGSFECFGTHEPGISDDNIPDSNYESMPNYQ